MSERAQLHELLAVESDLRGQATKILEETKSNFAKPELWKGSVAFFEPLDVAKAHLKEEAHEALPTTVEARLEYTREFLSKWYDAVLQKDQSNMGASAEIVVDDLVLAANVPGMTLLGLETKLEEFKGAISRMPTLDAKVEWKPAEGEVPGVWVSKFDAKNFRTEKVTEPVVLYPATDKHPAQVEKVQKDVIIGTVTKKFFSGAVTAARAAEILNRLEKLLRAVKEARQRANKAPIVPGKIGDALLGYVLQK